MILGALLSAIAEAWSDPRRVLPPKKILLRGEWTVWADSPIGTSIVFRSHDEFEADAFLAGYALGFEQGWDDAVDSTFDRYAVFDDEGNGPIMSRRRLEEICESNAAFAHNESSRDGGS